MQTHPFVLSRTAGALLAAVLACSSGAPALARNLVPPLKSPGDYLNEDDFERMSAAAARLYQGRSIGTVERWRNPDTGNAGSVKLLRQFKSGALPCMRMEYLMRFAGPNPQSHQYTMNWCRTGEGEWRILDGNPNR